MFPVKEFFHMFTQNKLLEIAQPRDERRALALFNRAPINLSTAFQPSPSGLRFDRGVDLCRAALHLYENVFFSYSAFPPRDATLQFLKTSLTRQTRQVLSSRLSSSDCHNWKKLFRFNFWSFRKAFYLGEFEID